MLVLSRQRDETIMIGDNVEITIVDIRGDKVRLGINAPTAVAVHRKEVYLAIQRENEEASRLAGAFDGGSVRPVTTPDAERVRQKTAKLAAQTPGTPPQNTSIPGAARAVPTSAASARSHT